MSGSGRVERPALRAGLGIEGADHAALDIGRAVVADGRADDYRVPYDRGRRCDFIFIAVANSHVGGEIDLSSRPEVCAWLA